MNILYFLFQKKYIYPFFLCKIVWLNTTDTLEVEVGSSARSVMTSLKRSKKMVVII